MLIILQVQSNNTAIPIQINLPQLIATTESGGNLNFTPQMPIE